MAIKREKVIKAAEKYVAKGKLEAAINQYRKVLKEEPDDINTLNRVGDLYARSGKIEEAVRLFTQIAEQYTTDGFFVKAIAIFKKIIKLDPSVLMVYERLAELYHRQGLLPEARTQYQVLADYYQKHENATSAITIYQRMSEMEPDNPSYLLKLAELFSAQRLMDKALTAYNDLAELMLRNDSVDEAAQVYSTALALVPENLDYVRQSVSRLNDAGHLGAAAKVLAKAAELNPAAAGLSDLIGSPEPEPAPVPEPEPEIAPEGMPMAEGPGDGFHPASQPDSTFAGSVEPVVELDPEPSGFGYDDTASSTGSFVGPDPTFEAPTFGEAQPEPTPSSPSNLYAEPEDDFEGEDIEFTFDLDDDEIPDTQVMPPDDMDAGPAAAPVADSAVPSETEVPDPDSTAPAALTDDDLVDPDFGEATISQPLQAVDPTASAAVAPFAEESSVEIEWSMDSMDGLDLDLPAPDDQPVVAEVAPAVAEPEPVPAEPEPVPVEPEPVPVEPEPVPVEPEPVPVEPEPVPVELEPVPVELEPVPAEPEPVPVEPEPVPIELEPIPVEPEPAPVEPEPAPPLQAPPLPAPAPPPAAAPPPTPVPPPAAAPPPAPAPFELSLDLDEEPEEWEQPAASVAAAPTPEAPPAPAAAPIEAAPAAAAEVDAAPPAVRREEDLLAEAQVFSKYGLKEKAVDRLDALLSSHPEHLDGLALRLRLDLDSGDQGRIRQQADRLLELSQHQGRMDAWEALRPDLENAGFAVGDSGIAAKAKAEPAEDDRIAQLLEDLSLEGFESPKSRRPSPVESLLAQDAPASAPPADPAPAASAPLPAAPLPQPGPPPAAPSSAADGLPVDADGGYSLANMLSDSDLEEDATLITSSAPPEPAAEPAPSPVELMDETGMSWLDEPTPEPGSVSAPKETIFDEEDDFFDLAAELEAELGEGASNIDEESLTTVEPQEQSLEEIIEGFKQGVAENLSPEDYDTHFNLGIAYREMGLMDEAIGEFQLASKDPRYLVECASMLGICFQEKGLMDLSVKWYQKGLAAPDISEEATLGMLYDMGETYIAMGNPEAAYKTFVEIYGMNTNFRDVSVRLQELGAG